MVPLPKPEILSGLDELCSWEHRGGCGGPGPVATMITKLGREIIISSIPEQTHWATHITIFVRV